MEPFINGESPLHYENFFPDSPLERLDKVLNSCNLSPKYFTLLALSPTLTPTDELPKLYKSLFGGTKYGVSSNPEFVMKSYLHTLTEIGFVSAEVTLGNNIVGYSTTPSGEKYGKPILAFVAAFEEKYGLSLFPTLGAIPTHSLEDIRSPLSRATILMHLKYGEKTFTELENLQKGIGNESVNTALSALEREKLISRKSHSSGKRSIYKIPDKPLRKIRHPSRIKRDVNAILMIKEICYQLAGEGEEIQGESVFNRIPENLRLATSINKVNKQLYDIARRGTLEVVELHEKNSSAALTELGELYVDELFLPIFDALQDGTSLQEMTAKLHMNYNGLVNLRLHALQVVDYYYPYSKVGKKDNNFSLINSIKDLLIGKNREFPAMTVQDMNRTLEIPLPSLRDLLTRLVDAEVVEKVKINGVNVYALHTKQIDEIIK